MKLTEHFKAFLDDTVNLNATRLEQLESSVGTIKDFIEAAEWKPRVKYFTEQGSWAHRTIIRPVEDKAFDADLVVMLESVPDWEARDYLTTLRAIFADHGTYKDKVRRFSHCITIEYAGERKIDIAPCVVGRLGGSSEEVCNHDANAFEPSAPDSYTQWLVERNSWTGGHALRKVTRLLKYLRDIKGTFTCPSFLLTTLLGERIMSTDADNTTSFADVPTALRTIVVRLDDWLQLRSARPRITNPVLASEVVSDLWSDEQYANFRNKVHQYREWIDDAYEETDRDESIGKWRRVFGDEFAKSVAIDKAARVTEAARLVLSSARGVIETASADLVALFSRFGRDALPPGFDALPHKERPPWKRARHGTVAVQVIASLHADKQGVKERDLGSGEGPLKKGRWLRFVVRTRDGFEFGREHDLRWRVTNTDREAHQAKCLRGGFEKSNDGHSHWESLAYRGVHTVEAFVVRRNDGVLVAQSGPFYVVVE
jgi:hypothetical protein